MTNMFSKKVVICSVVALGLSVSATAGRPSLAQAPSAQAQDQSQAQDLSQCLAQKEICENEPLRQNFEFLGADVYTCERHEYSVITDVTQTKTIETLQDWANSSDRPENFPAEKVLCPKMALGATDQNGNTLHELSNVLHTNLQQADTHNHRVETTTIDRSKVKVTYTWTTSNRTARGASKGEAERFNYDFNTEFNKARAKAAPASKSRK